MKTSQKYPKGYMYIKKGYSFPSNAINLSKRKPILASRNMSLRYYSVIKIVRVHICLFKLTNYVTTNKYCT